jgi:predicted HD superfamily hydrolase involved in NAD metabolism
MALHQIAASVRLIERLEAEEPQEVIDHSLAVAGLARELAAAHGVDPDRAEATALMHDIADRFTDVELLGLAERYDIPITLTEARVPKLLHAMVGAELLRREWGIDDEEILDAVRHHITGGVRMSPLAKVLFVADKLEPERDHHYGGLDGLRELAMRDLDAAVLRLYAWRMDELLANQRPISEELVSARNRLIDQTLASYR